VWQRWLTGVALAYSEGDGSFTQVEGDGGDLASSLTSVHPYVAYALSDRVRLWGMVGYGSGSLQLRLAEQDALDTDLSMTMGALGVRGSLLEPSQENGMQLALRSDVLWLRMDSAAITGLAATEAEVSRLRLVLEGSRPVALADGGSLIPTLEVGLRHDGGDAETGSGLEVGFGLRYASAWGLSLETSVNGLLAHEDAEYREWGASAALRFAPGREGRGLSASVAPAWGTSSVSGGDPLWGRGEGGLSPVGGAARQGPADTVRAGGGKREQRPGLATGGAPGGGGGFDPSLEASRRRYGGERAAHGLSLPAGLPWKWSDGGTACGATRSLWWDI
jgi:hypothetical protein